MSCNEAKDICLLIKNYIIQTKLLDRIDEKNEKQIISDILTKVYSELSKYIKIVGTSKFGIDDFTNKNIFNNKSYSDGRKSNNLKIKILRIVCI